MKCKTLKRNGLTKGKVVYRNKEDGLFYTGIDCIEGDKFILQSPTETNPNIFTFIPDCDNDHDMWDESLEIVGKDCEVWLNRRWNVLDKNNNPQTINLNYYLCRWSQAVNRYESLIKDYINLDEWGDIINKK